MEKAEILVSVIVPVYNTAPYLEACLDSLLAQSEKRLEIIVVDDGSTDTSSAILADYARRDARIVLSSTGSGAPHGLSVARNTGLRLASGRWFIFVDSDDLLPSDAIALLLAALRRHPAAAIACGVITPFADGSAPSCNGVQADAGYVDGRSAAMTMLYQTGADRGLTASACAKLFDGRRCAGLRFPPGLLYEDLAVVPLIAAGSGGVATCRATVYHYRLREGSITGSFSPRRLQVIDVCHSLTEHFASDGALLRAAGTRLFAAAFNMRLHLASLPSGSLAGSASVQRDLDSELMRLRGSVLACRGARLRDRVGALLLSCVGPRLLVGALRRSPALLRRLTGRR